MVDFDAVFGQDTDVAPVKLVTVAEFGEILGIDESFDFVLVQPLTEFGQGSHPGVVSHVVVIESDPLGGLVIRDVLLVLRLGHVSAGLTAGCNLEFKPGVDVVLEQPHLAVGEMQRLVDGLEDGPLGNGASQFGPAPRTGELALLVGVRAPASHVVQR